MFCVGFDGKSLPADVKQLLAQGVQNVILFARNVGTPQEFASLCREIKESAPNPVLISIDQEGGRVRRLRDGFTPVPSMRDLGKTADPDLAYRVGRLLARECRAVNVDVNFSPCLDVDTNPKNPVIADRSLGATPDLVSRMGVALLKGIQDHGVAACGKHFPGHGDTSQDSHNVLPQVPNDLERLDHVELPPFRAAIDAGIASLMSAHVIVTPLDPDYPATLSRRALDGILRDRFGFDGLLFSDDFEMKAIAAHYGFEDAITRSVLAGCDVIPVSHTLDLQLRGIETVIKSIESGRIPTARIEQANRRIDKLIEKYYQPPTKTVPPGVLASDEHLAVANEILTRIGKPTTEGKDPTDFVRK
jgi:beta-N-acetylhexosaminidase